MNVRKLRVGMALVALVALAGAIGYGTRTAQAAAITITGTKVCVATGPTTANCTAALTLSPGTTASTVSTLTVSLSGSQTFSALTAALSPPGCVSGGATASITGGIGTGTVTILISTGTSTCTGITLTETVGGLAAGTPNTISQSFTLAGADSGTASLSASVTTPSVSTTGTKTCTATGATTASCTLALAFTGFATGVTTVAVSLTAPAGASMSVTGASLTPSTCGTATVVGNTVTINASSACSGLTITETVSGLAAGTANTVSQTATVSGANSGTATASALVTTAAPTFTITCTSTPGAPSIATFNTFVPSTPAAPIAAVGIVPSAVACAVNLGTLDPGVVELSSVNGLLVSSSGTLTTNLRIPCGTTGVAGSCTGTISFLVAAGGVGAVTVQARYEPAPLSTSTERETSATIVFVAPSVLLTLSLSPNPVAVGEKGTARVTFLVQVNCATGTATVGAGPACVDVSTGTIITAVPSSSVLSGTVVFSIADTAFARWTGAVTAPAPGTTPTPPPVSSTGFTTSPNQVAVRCGFFPTSALPSATTIGAFFPVPSLSAFFGGCTSAQAQYEGVAPGSVAVNAQFIPDLPGAVANVPGLPVSPQVQALFGFVGATNITVTRTLEVVAAAPSGRIDLARGCNNVSPTVTEAAADYAKRVSPSGALVAIWEHQAATNTFRGFSTQAGAPSDLAQVTRLRPVFTCVSGPATLDQPAA